MGTWTMKLMWNYYPSNPPPQKNVPQFFRQVILRLSIREKNFQVALDIHEKAAKKYDNAVILDESPDGVSCEV